jgi:hypothetical protein
MGDPLHVAAISGGDMASSSRASARASFVPNAARGANAGSRSSRANLTLNGQTSWDVSHPYTVALSCQRRARRAASRVGEGRVMTGRQIARRSAPARSPTVARVRVPIRSPSVVTRKLAA